jgi:hypothetical protein
LVKYIATVLTPGVQVRSQDYEICGGQGGTGIVFPPGIAPIFISKVLHIHLHLYITLVRMTNERILTTFKYLKRGAFDRKMHQLLNW